MKNFMLLSLLLTFNVALSQTKNEYTFAIIDANSEVVVDETVKVIYNTDTLLLETNNRGGITLNIKYTYPCTTGARHGVFSKPLKGVSPTYSTAPITVIYKEKEGSFTKDWRSYFDKPERLQKDKYNYYTKQLIEEL